MLHIADNADRDATRLPRRTVASVKVASSLSIRRPNVSGGRVGDECKAVGSVLPTALLSELHHHENAA